MSAPEEKRVRVFARATTGQSRLVPGDGPDAIVPPKNRGVPFYDVPPKGREFHLTEKELARFRADKLIQLRFPDAPAVAPKNVFPLVDNIAAATPKGSQERILDVPKPPPPEPSTLPTVMAEKARASESEVEDDDDDDDEEAEEDARTTKPAPTPAPSKAPPKK